MLLLVHLDGMLIQQDALTGFLKVTMMNL